MDTLSKEQENYIKRTRQAREQSGLLQREVARSLGVAVNTYTNYELQRPMPQKYIASFCRITGVAEEWLLTGRQAQQEQPQGNHATIKEIDIRAGGGALAHDDDGEPVIATWGIPLSALQSHMHRAGDIRIIRVIGDSMAPSYRPGERIFVDIKDTMPSPPGVFIVYDGLGITVKRVEHIPHSDPPAIRLVPENKEYDAYTLTLDEAFIQGRVIGKLELC